MAIHVQCPGCGRAFRAPDALAGKRVQCPNCSGTITVGAVARPPDRPRADTTAKKEPLPKKPAAQPGAAAQWHVRTADEQLHGPVTKSQLDALVAEGRLDGFCRVHRGDWDHWKWIEDVYPGFAMSEEAEPEGFADGRKANTKPESRLQPCPDCGKTVSVRAIQCPNCGCPIIPLVTPTDAKERTDDPRIRNSTGRYVAKEKKTAPSRTGRREKRARRTLLLVVGSSVLLLLLIATAIGVGWQLWKRATGPYDEIIQSLSEEPAPPNEPVVPQPTTATTPEQIEQWMQEASAEMANKVDRQYRKVHTAMSTLGKVQEMAELIESLSQPRPESRRRTEPGAPPPPEPTPYRSQYEALYAECFNYILGNLPPDQRNRSNIRTVAGRWADDKLAPLEQNLEEALHKQLGP